MSHQFDTRPIVEVLNEIKILRSIVNGLADGVVVADRKGRFLLFNPVAQTILGIGLTDSESDQWSRVYGCYMPDGVTPFPCHELPLVRALNGEYVEETEIFIRNPERPKGVRILAKASPLLNEDGALCGGAVVFSDITRKKETEEEIRTLTNAVEQTADSIVITDRNGVITYVNPAFAETTGYTRGEALGRSPSILKSGAHDAAFYKEMWSTITSGKAFRATLTNRKKNGTLYYAEQTITPMRNSAGAISHFVAVIKDVTETRQLQQQEVQMQLARAVQQHLYRMPPPQIEGFDIAGASFPAHATGGDYFDFIQLPRRCIGISIGDVSGHGIGSALLMVELRAFLRAFAWKSSKVAEIFDLLNNALVSDLEPGRFVTLAFCRLHPATGSMTYGSAGHVPGFILHADGSLKQMLDSTGVPLGMFSGRKFECCMESELKPGEILALLTDGVTEAERPDQSDFGIDRAIECIRDHRGESARHIVEALFRRVREFSAGLPQEDDISGVVCKAAERD